MGEAILLSFFMQTTNNLRGLQQESVWVGGEGEETSEGNLPATPRDPCAGQLMGRGGVLRRTVEASGWEKAAWGGGRPGGALGPGGPRASERWGQASSFPCVSLASLNLRRCKIAWQFSLLSPREGEGQSPKMSNPVLGICDGVSSHGKRGLAGGTEISWVVREGPSVIPGPGEGTCALWP